MGLVDTPTGGPGGSVWKKLGVGGPGGGIGGPAGLWKKLGVGGPGGGIGGPAGGGTGGPWQEGGPVGGTGEPVGTGGGPRGGSTDPETGAGFTGFPRKVGLAGIPGTPLGLVPCGVAGT